MANHIFDFTVEGIWKVYGELIIVVGDGNKKVMRIIIWVNFVRVLIELVEVPIINESFTLSSKQVEVVKSLIINYTVEVLELSDIFWDLQDILVAVWNEIGQQKACIPSDCFRMVEVVIFTVIVLGKNYLFLVLVQIFVVSRNSDVRTKL